MVIVPVLSVVAPTVELNHQISAPLLMARRPTSSPAPHRAGAGDTSFQRASVDRYRAVGVQAGEFCVSEPTLVTLAAAAEGAE